jgi:hypothetical protein
MNFKIIELQPNPNQIMKLTSIFSILFVSMFFIANILTEDNRAATVKDLSSSTTLYDPGSKTLPIQSDSSLDESDIKIQSGMSSHVSNYINAWQLSKVTTSFQKPV